MLPGIGEIGGEASFKDMIDREENLILLTNFTILQMMQKLLNQNHRVH